MLILDEATSALDGETERLFIKALNDIPRSITVLSIAHRTETLKGFNKVYQLEKGIIINEGKPSKLISD